MLRWWRQYRSGQACKTIRVGEIVVVGVVAPLLVDGFDHDALRSNAFAGDVLLQRSHRHQGRSDLRVVEPEHVNQGERRGSVHEPACERPGGVVSRSLQANEPDVVLDLAEHVGDGGADRHQPLGVGLLGRRLQHHLLVRIDTGAPEHHRVAGERRVNADVDRAVKVEGVA